MRAAAQSALAKTGGCAHILNLGHGILPDVSVESARAFVQAGQTRIESATIEGTGGAAVTAPQAATGKL